jgi:NAD(P)-dependent dehydrogenase (short-subunit alcohol dehydrogenase family)
MSQHGQIDGLVAAAGIQQIKEAVNYTCKDVIEMLDVNYTGVLMSINAVARSMIDSKREGSIVLVASMSGLIANKGLKSPVYNSSKAAVIQLSRNLAMEWGRHNIRVNTLCPGQYYNAYGSGEFLGSAWFERNMGKREYARPVGIA